MKKLLFVVATMATILTSQAQDLSWGVKAGINVSSVVGKDINGTKSSVDFTGGLFAENKFSDLLGLSAEVLYSGQGCSMDVDGAKKNGHLNLAYINIPILANIYITDGLAVKAGIQAGIPISSKAKYDGVSATTKTLGIGGAQFDLAIPIGLSYQFNYGFLVDLRYNIGLTRVFEDTKAYNSVLQLTVGWRF